MNPRNGDIYFTDTQYGYWQYFRPEPGLPNQVYRLNPETGALTVVSDAFVSPNGMFRAESCLDMLPAVSPVNLEELTSFLSRRTHFLARWQLRLRHGHGDEPSAFRLQHDQTSYSVRILLRILGYSTVLMVDEYVQVSI